MREESILKNQDENMENTNERNAWKTFTATGSVADYLKYSALKRISENQYENINGRHNNSRTDNKRVGQDGDNSHKG